MDKQKQRIEEGVIAALNVIALEEVDLFSALFEGLLDSADLVAMVMEVEERFEVLIPIEEVKMENFKNGNTIVSFVQKLIGS